jgi:hypothetical protein
MHSDLSTTIVSFIIAHGKWYTENCTQNLIYY